jgi:8-oxo-dGTP diphosphatase
MPLLVVRHAPAGRRSAYTGDDRVRPLSARGKARAAELVGLLSRYHPQRVLSSPFTRCYETVRPIAGALGIPVESVDELAEGHGPDAVRLLHRMAGESAILCTHGDVALALLDGLVPGSDGTAKDSLRLQKGDVWVVRSIGDALTIVDHLGRAGGRVQKSAKGG